MLWLGFAAAPFKFGPSATWRFVGVLNESEKHHKQTMAGKPHWTLYSVGVFPDHQSKGVGSELLEPVLTVADSEKIPCYLDTDNAKSLIFFQRLGFKVEKDVNLNGAPRFWTMIRQPKV